MNNRKYEALSLTILTYHIHITYKKCCLQKTQTINGQVWYVLVLLYFCIYNIYSRDKLIWQKLEFIYCHKNLGINDQDRKIYGIICYCCNIGNYPPWQLLRVKQLIIYLYLNLIVQHFRHNKSSLVTILHTLVNALQA